jgi:hypothetical protein
MANVLTDLAADIYKAADKVGREVVGFIPSVTINGDGVERVSKGATITSHFTRTPDVDSNYAPSMSIPEGVDQTIDNKQFQINQFASVKIPWTGEEIKYLNNGAGYETIYGDQIQQAMRKITNTIEAYIASLVYKSSSRAVGLAGTTPFATNFDVVAEARQILVDNGYTPDSGSVSLVINTLAGTKMRNLAQLQKVNEAGNSELLRQGVLLDLQGIMIRESAGIVSHVKGTGTGFDINVPTTGEVAGQTTLTLDGGTTGATGIKAGDAVNFASDTGSTYIVNTGLNAVAGDIVIARPGLKATIPDATEMTIGNNYTPNVMFHRNAVELAIRAPATPGGGDAAVDTMVVQDTWSGLTFEISAYKGYMKAMFDIRCLYDAKVWIPEGVATILG